MIAMRTNCRICGGTDLISILSMGDQPPANALLASIDDEQEVFPLELVVCGDCGLAQTTTDVPPEALFRSYPYFSSYAQTMTRSAEALARRLGPSLVGRDGALVMEIASNDGYLLQYYQAQGIPVLGIEPALNVAAVAQSKGIETITEFFAEEIAKKLRARYGQADVVHANNVLAHVPDLKGFIHGLKHVLKEDGVAIVEVPYVREMVDKREFDTVYHEHLCYFSASVLSRLFAEGGLSLFDVERLHIHGGSLRLFVGKRGKEPTEALTALLSEERHIGLGAPDYFSAFAGRVAELKKELLAMLESLKAQGQSIAAYSASAKGTTLLNTFGIDGTLIDFTVDKNPDKQGRFLPGARIPVLDPAALLDRRPDVVLILVWNLVDEIVAQQKAYRESGGRFIVPVPDIRIIE